MDAQHRHQLNLRTGWRFTLGNPPGAATVSFDDSAWQAVSVPHDWGVMRPFDPFGETSTGKLRWRDSGWYRCRLTLPGGAPPCRVYLVFDGVMARPCVYVNGHLAGQWDYGYSAFVVDATEFARFDAENMLAVFADTAQHGSRWYPGGGIYRDVAVIVTDPVHVPVWGTHITTPDIRESDADVRVRTTVNNADDRAHEVRIETVIVDPQGHETAAATSTHHTDAGMSHEFDQTLTLARAQRWDIDNPALYTAVTVVRRDGQACDRCVTSFGVRKIRFTGDHGFLLNDRRVPFKGVNLHHDHGPLGAAFHPRAMQRQLEIMKDMGVNAVRTSHNVAASVLLDLCDHMGILVYNEAFDKWDDKADITPDTDFDEFARRNLRNFVVRDRNHPSVICWSVANEDSWLQQDAGGSCKKLDMMVDIVREFDPTRPVTMACNEDGALDKGVFNHYDLHAWNYAARYARAHRCDPAKAAFASESASALSTRGYYEFPHPRDKTDYPPSRYLTSYDHHACTWSELADDDFAWLEHHRYACGEFVWTGFDYLGEPTPFTEGESQRGGPPLRVDQAARSAYFGIVDLCGFPKDRFYLYRSHWAPEKPTVHILPHWSWPERVGMNVPVYVYTNGDSAELFLNGRSLGRRSKTPGADNHLDRYRLRWEDIVYEPGMIEAVAYREGIEIGRAATHTAGEPARIRLTPDRTEIAADGLDLSYVTVEVEDADAVLCPRAENLVVFNVEGPADIAGVGNGDPLSREPFQADRRRLFFGKAMLILRSRHGSPGRVTVTATAEGLPNGRTSLHVR